MVPATSSVAPQLICRLARVIPAPKRTVSETVFWNADTAASEKLNAGCNNSRSYELNPLSEDRAINVSRPAEIKADFPLK